MAVTVDQANAGTQATSGVASGGTANTTTTATIAAGACIVVLTGAFVSGGGQNLSVTGSGLTWTVGHESQNGNIRAEIWYAFAPAGLASGSTIGTVLGGATGGDVTFVIASYLGVDSTGTITGLNAAGATNTTWASGSVTANAGDALIGGSWVDGTLSTSTATGPAVERIDFNSATTGESVTLVDKLSMSATDSLAGTWSNSVTHVGIAAAFKPSAAAVAAPTAFIPHRMPLGV